MRVVFGIFPLLSIPIIIYNLLAFAFRPPSATDIEAGTAGALDMTESLASPLATVNMVADDAVWAITSGDVLLLIGLALLFIEIIKSTSTGAATIFNHAVSMILFIIALVEFLLFKNFATSIFFILTMMCLLDVLAGVVVTIVSARRDFGVGEGFGG